MDYITINLPFIAVIPIPGSVSGDTVTYVIYLSNGSIFASGNMTFIADEMWKVTFTPTTIDTYILKVNDSTISSKRENVYSSVGSLSDIPAPSQGDLTTLSQVKTFLTITDTDSDSILQNLITGTSQFILQYINRNFFLQNYTEYHSGNGNPEIVVSEWPVTAVASLYDDTSRLYTASTLIATTDYVWWEDGRIELDRGLRFAIGRKNIQVTYAAGYDPSDIPMDLQMAVWKIVALTFKDSSTGLAAPETINLLNMIQQFRNSEVLGILNNYRKGSSR